MSSLQITTEQAVETILSILDKHDFYPHHMKQNSDPKMIHYAIQSLVSWNKRQTKDETLQAADTAWYQNDEVSKLVLSHVLSFMEMKRLKIDPASIAFTNACVDVEGNYHREIPLASVAAVLSTAKAAGYSLVQFFIDNGVVREVGAIEWSADIKFSEFDFVVATNAAPRMVLAALAGWRDAYLPVNAEVVETVTV